MIFFFINFTASTRTKYSWRSVEMSKISRVRVCRRVIYLFRVLNQRNFDCRIEKEKLDNLQDLLCVHYNIAFCFSGLGLSGQQSSGRPKNLGHPLSEFMQEIQTGKTRGATAPKFEAIAPNQKLQLQSSGAPVNFN